MQNAPVSDLPTSVQFDFATGIFAPSLDLSERRMSDLAEMYYDQAAVQKLLQGGNPVIYEIRYHPFVTSNSDMSLGVTRLFPGRIGDEYHMTKGHFHERLDQPEIYFCIHGEGYLLLETREGDFRAEVEELPGFDLVGQSQFGGLRVKQADQAEPGQGEGQEEGAVGGQSRPAARQVAAGQVPAEGQGGESGAADQGDDRPLDEKARGKRQGGRGQPGPARFFQPDEGAPQGGGGKGGHRDVEHEAAALVVAQDRALAADDEALVAAPEVSA